MNIRFKQVFFAVIMFSLPISAPGQETATTGAK